jgi:hypothetical protein
MDAGRFDSLSRSLANRRSRRSLGAGGLAAGLLTAFGAERANAATGDCSLRISAKTSAGPHKNTTYAGTLTMTIDQKGAIDSGVFKTDDGVSHPLVGQAVGRALNLRIALADGKTLALAGTADLDLILCRGDVSGTFGGPGDTDIGMWRTVNAAGTTTNSSGSANGASGSGSGGSPSDNSGTGTTSDGGDNSGGGATTGSGCDAGQSLCDGQCVDLQTDLNNCGRCGFWCGSGLVCTAGVCVDPGCGNDPQTGAALTLCTGVCINIATDSSHCGSCDNACTSGAQCVNGACTCAPDGSPCTYPSDCCADTCAPGGVCGCIPTGSACPETNNTGDCCEQGAAYCVNGYCSYANGAACAGNTFCISGNCKNGVCVDSGS